MALAINEEGGKLIIILLQKKYQVFKNPKGEGGTKEMSNKVHYKALKNPDMEEKSSLLLSFIPIYLL